MNNPYHDSQYHQHPIYLNSENTHEKNEVPLKIAFKKLITILAILSAL